MSKLVPPSYEESFGSNLPLFGKPEDLEKALRIAGQGSRIYAALTISDETINKIAYAQLKTFAIIPCLWCHLICAGPCLAASSGNTKAMLKNTTYIITNDRIIISVADHSPPCNCCVSSGNDTGEFELEKIIEVSVDNRGRGCNMFKSPSVRLALPTRQVFLFVDNPTEIAALIRDLRKARDEARNQPAIIQQPLHVNSQSSQTKRVFVASAMAPTDFKIVILQGDTLEDWESFRDEITRKFNLDQMTQLSFYLADMHVPVTSAEDLSANDKVLFASKS